MTLALRSIFELALNVSRMDDNMSTGALPQTVTDEQYSYGKLLQLARELAIELGMVHTFLHQAITCYKAAPEPEWINSAMVARMLGISPRTLASLRSKGIVKSYRLHGKLYYKTSEVRLLPGFKPG